jgi:ABC-type dipeptide/oligopeptide/nickel transport system ATPase component
MFTHAPHIQQMLNAVAKVEQDVTDAILLKRLAGSSKTQRKYVVETTLTMCNATYARLLLQHYTHEISVRNVKYLQAVADNF